ncbi:hypothetical protein JRQ81_011571 [Phrynocephalus forsythii]|uniref:Uncharacterized protein n=1 Tax=Phrynocephalus forsythii TaxID=171643 RepID=A0A9Q1AQ62_9SAUR|nr:hypothetical protein JRQ81_011571 [Phrynocephalus forsythii]
MASLTPQISDNLPQPPGERGTPGLPAPLQLGTSLSVVGSGSKSVVGTQDFLLPPPLPPIPPPLPPVFNQPAPSNLSSSVIYSLSGSPVASSSSSSSSPRLVQTVPGSFPDIYDGDVKKWEEHFRSIQRAYKELGKEDDFAIRVLTEDFTLPFPFAWPSESEASQPPVYDPADCSGFDFFLHSGQPVPRLLQPLHATTQAFFKKRHLEQMALTFASKASLANTSGMPTPPETGPTFRPDIMVITSMPCVATTAAPAETTFLVQDGKAQRNTQPGPMATPRQPVSLQFMSPTHQGPF